MPVIVIASALTGLAGAAFNPAVRAYLAQEAGERKVEAFAVFNVFYQLGIPDRPAHRVAARRHRLPRHLPGSGSAVRRAGGGPSQSAPARRGSRADAESTMLRDWHTALANRAFVLFSLAMIGSYVLNFQVYLGLPIEIRRLTGGELGVTLLFVVSGAPVRCP